MDLGEYRLEKSKEGLYDIKVSRWICYCPIFTIKGQKAAQDDFGEGEDIDFANKPKYGITIDEYNEIASVLEEGLSFGHCRLCS